MNPLILLFAGFSFILLAIFFTTDPVHVRSLQSNHFDYQPGLLVAFRDDSEMFGVAKVLSVGLFLDQTVRVRVYPKRYITISALLDDTQNNRLLDESATGISINCLAIQRVALDTDAVTPIGFEPVSNGEDANCVTWKGNEKDADHAFDVDLKYLV